MKKFLVLSLAFGFIGCKNVDTAETDLASLAEKTDTMATEAVVETLSKAADDFATDLAENDMIVEEVLTDHSDFAEVDVPGDERPDGLKRCGKPAVQRRCHSHGERSFKGVRYDDCVLPGTKSLANGFVKITFNNPICSMKRDGNKLARVYELSLASLATDDDNVKSITSETQLNYLDERVGGGETLENTDFGWKLAIKGRQHEVFNASGDKIKDLSIHTEKPLNVYNELGRRARVITGGAVVVDHNLAKFSQKYTPYRLAWTSTCLCPVSGSLDIEYSGSVEGGGSIEFIGCGKAIAKRDSGDPFRMNMPKCLPED